MYCAKLFSKIRRDAKFNISVAEIRERERERESERVASLT